MAGTEPIGTIDWSKKTCRLDLSHAKEDDLRCRPPRLVGGSGVFAVRLPGPEARTPMSASPQGWKATVLGLVKKYGGVARFAATTVLNAALPGAPVVVELVGKAIDAAQSAAQDNWEQTLERALAANAAELERVGEVFGVLAGDLDSLMRHVAALDGMPEAADRILRVALASDERVRVALVRLEGLASRFDRLDEQNRRLLDGQDEMLPLMRRMAGVASFVEELRGAGINAVALGELLRQRQEAAAALAAGRVADAEPVLRRIAEARPESASAQEALASAELVCRRPAEAERALKTAVRLRPADAELSELHRRATRAAGSGDTQVPPAGGKGGREAAVGDVIDGWLLEEHLGGRGWGVVFRASRQGQARALKVLRHELAGDRAFVERFKREIAALYGLPRHPALVRIDSFGYAAEQGRWYLLMEHVAGDTLERHLARSGPLSSVDAAGLFVALAEGLAEAHCRGVVNGDIKPGNILLQRPGGEPVLIDFGLATAADALASHSAGGHTPMFASPEQLRGRPADSRSDVYCLAASLYYCLAYDRPGSHEPDQFEPCMVPPQLRAVLEKGLAARPADRFADAGAFGLALRQALGKGGTATSVPPAPEPLRARCPACGVAIKVPANLVGRKVKCPKCSHSFVAGQQPFRKLTTRLQEEVQGYEKAIAPRLGGIHLAPHTLEVAAMWAVLTRLEQPRRPGVTLVQKLRLYDGQPVQGLGDADAAAMRREAPSEGTFGVPPDYVLGRIEAAIAAHPEEKCRNPFMAIHELEKGLGSLATDEARRKSYGEFLSAVKEEYERVATEDVQRAVAADEDALARLCSNYIDNVWGYTQREKVRNKYTGNFEEPDERLMRSVEEKIDVPAAGKDGFRRALMNQIGSLAADGNRFDSMTNPHLRKAPELKLAADQNQATEQKRRGTRIQTILTAAPRLRLALERKLFEDQKPAIKLTSLLSGLLSGSVDRATQEKIDVIQGRLIRNRGYCDLCSMDILTFVASIYARPVRNLADLATTHLREGRLDPAVEKATEALSHDAGCVDALVVRASAYLGKGDHDRAIADAERALQLAPGNAAALDVRTRACEARAKAQYNDDKLASLSSRKKYTCPKCGGIYDHDIGKECGRCFLTRSYPCPKCGFLSIRDGMTCPRCLFIGKVSRAGSQDHGFSRPTNKASTARDAGAEADKDSEGFDWSQLTAQGAVSEVSREVGGIRPPKREAGRKVNIHIGQGIEMGFAWIPPGTFLMGSPSDEEGRCKDERQHRVTLTRGFFLGINPVTQEQWQAVTGVNPSRFKGANRPVESVGWNDCREFCKLLGERTGKRFRLPTEAEWEYACRSGTNTPFHFGVTISTDQANFDGRHAYGQGREGGSRQQTTPAGSFPPNAWGLYDMHGNVFEWCLDWYGSYREAEATDPQGPDYGSTRTRRGGAWYYGPECCRSAYRYCGNQAAYHKANYGCRICLESD